jgi:hypothetical protein
VLAVGVATIRMLAAGLLIVFVPELLAELPDDGSCCSPSCSGSVCWYCTIPKAPLNTCWPSSAGRTETNLSDRRRRCSALLTPVDEETRLSDSFDRRIAQGRSARPIRKKGFELREIPVKQEVASPSSRPEAVDRVPASRSLLVEHGRDRPRQRRPMIRSDRPARTSVRSSSTVISRRSSSKPTSRCSSTN